MVTGLSYATRAKRYLETREGRIKASELGDFLGVHYQKAGVILRNIGWQRRLSSNGGVYYIRGGVID